MMARVEVLHDTQTWKNPGICTTDSFVKKLAMAAVIESVNKMQGQTKGHIPPQNKGSMQWT